MNTVSKSLLSMALAAGAVYFLDPVSGRRRRVLLRDQCSRAVRSIDHKTRSARHGFSDRMHNIAESTKTQLKQPTSDRAIGRGLYKVLRRSASHPRSLGLSVHDGHIFLRGDIYSHEHQRVLDEIRALPGVRVITDHLTLREAGERLRPAADGARDGWSTLGRVFVGAGGCALLLWGVRERKSLGEFGSSVGHAIRDFANKDLGGQIDSFEHAIERGAEAVGEAGREAVDATRAWQSSGDRSGDGGHSRVAV